MKKRIRILLIGVLAVSLLCGFLQFYWAHRWQRGEAFENIKCVPLLGWFTREDRLTEGSMELLDLQPGDILITLATHSMGWRHGHAGLVVDEETVLECVSIGQKSALVKIECWETYANIAVLRVKEASIETKEKVVSYAMEKLRNVPYHLSSGFVGEKAPETDEVYFGLHCSYLVWYAWNHFGYDLDSDGGRLVTSHDLLRSKRLEVIQSYGMEPWGIKTSQH